MQQKQEKIILLIPELSYITGLSDSIRSNYKMMRDLDTITKVAPSRRREDIKLFLEEIKENAIAQEMLSGWGLRLSNDIIQFSGRCLGPEKIFFGANRTYMSQEKSTDWTIGATRSPVLRTVSTLSK